MLSAHEALSSSGTCCWTMPRNVCRAPSSASSARVQAAPAPTWRHGRLSTFPFHRNANKCQHTWMTAHVNMLGAAQRFPHQVHARAGRALTVSTLPYPTQMLMSMIMRKCSAPQQAFVGAASPAVLRCVTRTAEHRSLLAPPPSASVA